ncbi:MAG: hypothetical protein JNK11_05275 [Alphaproteobacteria bacterium]|nr:hypothetical protein [Alphaproteobacteria bacterium]
MTDRRIAGLGLALLLAACGEQDAGPRAAPPKGNAPSIVAETVVGRATTDDFANALAATPDGGLAVVGQSGRDGWLVRLDQKLSVRENGIIPTGSSSRSIIAALARADGGLDVAGSDWSVDKPGHAWVARLDPRDGVVWETLFPEAGFFSQVNGFAPLPDGGAVALGIDFVQGEKGSSEFVWVRRLDRDGRILAEDRREPTAIEGKAAALAAHADGSLTLVGRRIRDDGVEDGWVRRQRADGRVDWEAAIGGAAGEEFLAAAATGDGGLYAAGYTRAGRSPKTAAGSGAEADGWVVRLDPAGRVAWQVRTGLDGQEDAIDRLAVLPDGGVLAAGTAEKGDGSPGGTLFAWRLAADGTSLWRFEIARSPLLYKIGGLAIRADGTAALAIGPDGRTQGGDSRVILLGAEAKR